MKKKKTFENINLTKSWFFKRLRKLIKFLPDRSRKKDTNNFFKNDFRERKGKKERIFMCFSTCLCIHWLILICALTEDRTCNLDVSG